MKRKLMTVFMVVFLLFFIIYFYCIYSAKKYEDIDSIKLISVKMIPYEAECGFEIRFSPNSTTGEIAKYDEKYYESLYGEIPLPNVWYKISSFECLILLNHCEKKSIRDSEKINGPIVKYTQFDKICYYVNFIATGNTYDKSYHYQKKGISEKDVDYLYSLMRIVYFIHTNPLFFILALFIVGIIIYILKKQKKVNSV